MWHLTFFSSISVATEHHYRNGLHKWLKEAKQLFHFFMSLGQSMHVLFNKMDKEVHKIFWNEKNETSFLQQSSLARYSPEKMHFRESPGKGAFSDK